MIEIWFPGLTLVLWTWVWISWILLPKLNHSTNSTLWAVDSGVGFVWIYGIKKILRADIWLSWGVWGWSVAVCEFLFTESYAPYGCFESPWMRWFVFSSICAMLVLSRYGWRLKPLNSRLVLFINGMSSIHFNWTLWFSAPTPPKEGKNKNKICIKLRGICFWC